MRSAHLQLLKEGGRPTTSDSPETQPGTGGLSLRHEPSVEVRGCTTATAEQREGRILLPEIARILPSL